MSGVGVQGPFDSGTSAGLAGTSSDPSLSELGSVAAGNSPSFALVLGDYLFVAVSSDNKVKAFDISNRDAPVEIDDLTVSAGPCHLAARGKYLFCWCQGAGAMVSIDISDPTTMAIAQTLTTRAGQRFTLNGRYAVVGGPESGGSANTLSVIDTNDPTAMAEVGTLVIGDIHRNIETLTRNLVALASRDNNTLYIIDISNPAAPVSIGSLASLTQTLTPMAADPQFAQGRPYLYTSSYGDGKFRVIDLSNPTSPRVAGLLTATINAEWIAIEGRYAFVAIRGTGSIDVIDIGNPAKPELIGNTNGTAARFDRLAVANGRIYAPEVAASGKVWTFAITGGKSLPPAPLPPAGDQLDRAGLIGLRTFTPTSDYITSSATLADIDATNLYWDFVAPRSGKVRLSMEALYQATGSVRMIVGLATGTTPGAAGVSDVANQQRDVGVDSGTQRRSISFLLTGLTPGTRYVYVPRYATGTAATAVTIKSNNTSGRGDILMAVDVVPA